MVAYQSVRLALPKLGSVSILFCLAVGCGFVPLPGLGGSENPAPLPNVDGIDPRQPNIERSTRTLDFTGVRTIRVELHTARLVIEQVDSGTDEATLQVTEIITAGWLGKNDLENHLIATELRAERSFVDSARLNVTSIISQGLQPKDVAFDVKLTVPRGAGTEIYLTSGPVEILRLAANVEIATADGAILVTDAAGNIVAKTTNHPVEIRGARGNVDAVTSNADVSIRAMPSIGAQVLARTAGGNARVLVQQGFGAALKLVADGGAVSANLNGFAVSNIATAAGLLTAELNGGGGRIEALVEGGDIEFAGITQP
ncbi:MAG: hypothetical protein HBSAPP02_29750 [Phycisphaerae bacterium]|nr:MAG: hypothetical protein HRU71_09400 [Planctomycetia bacterium]GJQ27943.1 MAG: hypothetical protein HBSAPP02_29750 [Phycisphaerae bacterium]